MTRNTDIPKKKPKKPEKTRKNPKKPEKTRKNPKKPDKTRKNPGGLGFLKKTRVFANPDINLPVW